MRGCDRFGDFGFEDLDEAGCANAGVVLRAEDLGAGVVADFADGGRHVIDCREG